VDGPIDIERRPREVVGQEAVAPYALVAPPPPAPPDRQMPRHAARRRRARAAPPRAPGRGGGRAHLGRGAPAAARTARPISLLGPGRLRLARVLARRGGAPRAGPPTTPYLAGRVSARTRPRGPPAAHIKYAHIKYFITIQAPLYHRTHRRSATRGQAPLLYPSHIGDRDTGQTTVQGGKNPFEHVL